MYCPNCGKENSVGQKFCRACGLELETIIQFLIELEPKTEAANAGKKRELFERLGLFSLSSFLLLGFSYLFYKVIYYKLILFGAGVLEGFALAFLFVFGLVTVFFFNYHRFFGVNSGNAPSRETEKEFPSIETKKLLEEKFVEPVPNITKNSAEILSVENKTRKFK